MPPVGGRLHATGRRVVGPAREDFGLRVHASSVHAMTQSTRPHIVLVATAAFYAALALLFCAGGALLLSRGGSSYYLIAGAGLLFCAAATCTMSASMTESSVAGRSLYR